MELLPPSEIARMAAERPALAIEAKEKVHTAERLPAAQRADVLRKFAAGKSRRQIAGELGLSRNTVAACIHQAEQEGAIDRIRDRMARRLEGILDDHLIQIEQENPKLSVVDWAILFDKLSLMQGAATMKVDVVVRKEDEAAVLEDLKRLAAGVIDAEIVSDPAPSSTP